MRLTRAKDEYECRIAGGCPAEEWMYSLYEEAADCCFNCPFEVYINKLAEYEDKEEINNADVL